MELNNRPIFYSSALNLLKKDMKYVAWQNLQGLNLSLSSQQTSTIEVKNLVLRPQVIYSIN